MAPEKNANRKLLRAQKEFTLWPASTKVDKAPTDTLHHIFSTSLSKKKSKLCMVNAEDSMDTFFLQR